MPFTQLRTRHGWLAVGINAFLIVLLSLTTACVGQSAGKADGGAADDVVEERLPPKGLPDRMPGSVLGSGDSGASTRGNDVELWLSFAASLESAREVEHFGTLQEIASSADIVVVGVVTEVRLARVVSLGKGVPAIPLAEFVVDVRMVSDSEEPRPTLVTFEVPFVATSPNLELAIAGAIDQTLVDKALTDKDLVEAVDQDAVDQAYQDHYMDAVVSTVEGMNAGRPSALSVFFLRLKDEDGSGSSTPRYRFVNGSGLIANVGGVAKFPLRLEPDHDGVVSAVEGMPFEAVLTDLQRVRKLD